MRQAAWTLAALLAFLLPACGSKPQDMILGKWETTDIGGKVVVGEFSKDGTVSWPVPLIGIRVDGKYRWTDDQHIEMEFGQGGLQRKENRKVEVTKETLTLTDDKSKNTQIWKRVKQ